MLAGLLQLQSASGAQRPVLTHTLGVQTEGVHNPNGVHTWGEQTWGVQDSQLLDARKHITKSKLGLVHVPPEGGDLDAVV